MNLIPVQYSQSKGTICEGLATQEQYKLYPLGVRRGDNGAVDGHIPAFPYNFHGDWRVEIRRVKNIVPPEKERLEKMPGDDGRCQNVSL